MSSYMLSLLKADQIEKTELANLCNTLLQMLYTKSPHLYAHAIQVKNYSVSIAAYLGLPAYEREQIGYAALLHDIGMLALPNNLINSYPHLNRQEYARYKYHVIAGASMLENYTCCQNIIPYIMYHHEHWDGSGYPKHLKKDNIPFGARIISVADFYDNSVNPTTEFWAKTKTDACNDLLSASGILYDPDVVKAFIKILN